MSSGSIGRVAYARVVSPVGNIPLPYAVDNIDADSILGPGGIYDLKLWNMLLQCQKVLPPIFQFLRVVLTFTRIQHFTRCIQYQHQIRPWAGVAIHDVSSVVEISRTLPLPTAPSITMGLPSSKAAIVTAPSRTVARW